MNWSLPLNDTVIYSSPWVDISIILLSRQRSNFPELLWKYQFRHNLYMDYRSEVSINRMLWQCPRFFWVIALCGVVWKFHVMEYTTTYNSLTLDLLFWVGSSVTSCPHSIIRLLFLTCGNGSAEQGVFISQEWSAIFHEPESLISLLWLKFPSR